MSQEKPEASLADLRAAKIMMVDDEETTIDVLEATLEDAGYCNFVKTTDSRHALELLSQERADLLLLDLNMPHVGGFEILQAIRRDEALKHTPVIILTSATDSGTKLRALELGATDFLGKPVDPSELALRLRNTLAAKAYLDRLRYYDSLTDLPNRRLLMDCTQRMLRRAAHDASGCAILHVDLDRFQKINEALERRVGDAVIKGVAARLEECLRPGDLIGSASAGGAVLARVAGDEFVLVVPWAQDEEAASSLARRVLARVALPFDLHGQDLFVTCSIGVALFPADGDSVETLLSHAEIATSHAKANGRNTFRCYAPSLSAESVERLSLENQLRRALERDQLLLHYQPKVDMRSGRIVGAEALMRWQHPELGSVPPSRFIPVAESTGLIQPIGAWALETACRQAKTWSQVVAGPVRISVNVSSQQFRHGGLPEMLRRALEQNQVDAQWLVLELTESMLMENPEESREMLTQIRRMGVRLSIDDFGTGYSSLAYLKRFPLNELKIDRSFVKGVPSDADDAAIVTAIIAMAHGLGLSAVAEGVETQEQLEFLAERGCDEYQGYLFSRPVPAADWDALLEG